MRRSEDVSDIMLGLLSAGGLFFAGLAALCTAGLAVWAPADIPGGSQEFQVWSSLALGATALFGIPGLLVAARGILDDRHPLSRRPSHWWLLLLLTLPAAAAVNHLVYEREILPAPFGLTTNLLTAVFAVVLSLHLVRRSAPPVSVRRLWGQFLTGLYAVPPLILVFELMALIPIAALITASLMTSSLPAISPETLMDPNFDPQQYLEQIDLEAITDPGSIALLVAYLGLIVPMIEELLKTSALWFVMKRITNPGEAYLAGALAGAGYGFFEALMLSQPGPEWAQIGLLRIGATFLHTAVSGLAAWGLFLAFRYRKWPAAFAAYTGAVFVHGIWNLNAIAMSWITTAREELPLPTALNPDIYNAVPVSIFIILSAVSLISLPVMARWTAKHTPGSASTPLAAAQPAARSADTITIADTPVQHREQE